MVIDLKLETKMLKVALDFDSVLSDTMIRWVELFNEKKGTKLTKKDVVSWSFWNDFHITMDEAFDIFEEAWSDWKNLPPTEDNITDKVKQLTNISTVDIVTHVRDSHLQYVKMWLKNKNISYENFVSVQGDKMNLSYDVFIDDSPNVAQNSSQSGKDCLLYDQPWNRNIKGEKITRIKSLDDAFTFIKKINEISVT